MSVEPIRPEDHSVLDHDNSGHSAVDAVHSMQMDVQLNIIHHMALREAIHQTFERDAVPRICGSCGDLSRVAVGPEDGSGPGSACCMNPMLCDGRDCDLPPDECDHHNHIDPDTEIDRLARLIVQGEYRRRQSQEPTP